MRSRKFTILAAVALAASLTLAAVPVSAATTCTFTVSGSTMTLDADCTTDATIVVPDGFTLDGNGKTITAIDPVDGHFHDGIIRNEGATAYVKNVTVTASALANVCDSVAWNATVRYGPLSGIMFFGASGSITNTTVIGINQGASGCQEGNAIDVRNPPFDGSGDNTVTVEIAHNYVDDWQKTGILANGDMTVSIHHNFVGDSANQDYLAPNSIQIADGVEGSVLSNRIEGNQWLGWQSGDICYDGTAILAYAPGAMDVSKNFISGNSDVGIFVLWADGGTYAKNKVFDTGIDGPMTVSSECPGDAGIYVWDSTGATFTKNHVKGFDTPFYPDPLSGDKNKALPSVS